MQHRVALPDRGRTVTITFANDEMRRFHAVWLRDNAQAASTRAPAYLLRAENPRGFDPLLRPF